MYKKYSNEYWMNYALEQARLALQEDEVPIGAVLVKDNEIVVADHNRTRQINNNLAHAASFLKSKWLKGCSLYVTIEPCLMCAGAIIWARIGKIVFGCYDPKAGAVGSIYNALLDKNYNHHPEVVSGILAQECSDLIVEFFRNKR